MPKFCSSCGGALADNAKFCSSCGAPAGSDVGAPSAPAVQNTEDEVAGEIRKLNGMNQAQAMARLLELQSSNPGLLHKLLPHAQKIAGNR